jgi:uncharacterized damage-inducible protein DinB
MTPDAAVMLAAYNRWMNQRMYEAAGTLSEDALCRDRGAFFGSILRTLNHIAVADTIWLHRFSQAPEATALREALKPYPLPTSLRRELADTLSGLVPYRTALDAVITQWTHTLTIPQLAGMLAYCNTTGAAFCKPMSQVVLHFFNHQTHHRGQASTLLCQAGVDPGVTDLISLTVGEA